MFNIVSRTDPISLKDLGNTEGLPYLVDQDAEHTITIYFESEANRKAFLDIPVEHPISELSVNLDNPTDEMIDEG
jgi:hypothetical protein